MAKAARVAKANTTGSGKLVQSLVFGGSVLGCVLLAFTLIHRLLPFLQLLLPVVTGWWLWRRYRIAQSRQQKRLRTAFYRLLREHHGQIMLLDFAMTVELSAIAARHYLDSRAQEFAAHFEVTEQGDVVYVFSSVQFSRSESSHALPHALAPHPLATPAPADQTNAPALPALLTQAELAKRLGVAAKTISRKKHSPLLSDWTQARDPDGVGWSYAAHTQRFAPVRNEN